MFNCSVCKHFIGKTIDYERFTMCYCKNNNNETMENWIKQPTLDFSVSFECCELREDILKKLNEED